MGCSWPWASMSSARSLMPAGVMRWRPGFCGWGSIRSRLTSAASQSDQLAGPMLSGLGVACLVVRFLAIVVSSVKVGGQVQIVAQVTLGRLGAAHVADELPAAHQRLVLVTDAVALAFGAAGVGLNRADVLRRGLDAALRQAGHDVGRFGVRDLRQNVPDGLADVGFLAHLLALRFFDLVCASAAESRALPAHSVQVMPAAAAAACQRSQRSLSCRPTLRGGVWPVAAGPGFLRFFMRQSSRCSRCRRRNRWPAPARNSSGGWWAALPRKCRGTAAG